MRGEGVTGHLRAPALEMDIKQVEVGHLADFGVVHAIRGLGAAVQWPLMAVASTGQFSSLPGAGFRASGLLERLSPRDHAGSLRLPSAVQTHG